MAAISLVSKWLMVSFAMQIFVFDTTTKREPDFHLGLDFFFAPAHRSAAKSHKPCSAGACVQGVQFLPASALFLFRFFTPMVTPALRISSPTWVWPKPEAQTQPMDPSC